MAEIMATWPEIQAQAEQLGITLRHRSFFRDGKGMDLIELPNGQTWETDKPGGPWTKTAGKRPTDRVVPDTLR